MKNFPFEDVSKNKGFLRYMLWKRTYLESHRANFKAIWKC